MKAEIKEAMEKVYEAKALIEELPGCGWSDLVNDLDRVESELANEYAACDEDVEE